MEPLALQRLVKLQDIYYYWNTRINVISRKDLSNLYINHILHSLSLAKLIPFHPYETVIDIGTGGGFPGIPLAILYPEVRFTLIDATRKKIRVVESISKELQLNNLNSVHTRAEDYKGSYNYVVSRAVCSFPRMVKLSAGLLSKDKVRTGIHGIYSLKGGDINDEISSLKEMVSVFDISNFFKEEFFKTKRIVLLSSEKLM